MKAATLLLWLPVLLLYLPAQTMAQGAIIERLDDLAGVPVAEAHRGPPPATIDLSSRLPPPRDQGPTKTCASWAATYAAASEALRRGSADRRDLKLSPAFTYRLAGGGEFCRDETKISRTLTVLQNDGALPIEEFVFDAGWCDRRPTPKEIDRARQFRIRGWSRLPGTDLTEVKGQLASGRPVVFAMLVGPAFLKLKGDAAFDTVETGPGTQGHSMVLVGYDDTRQALRLQNSFGRNWGDGGYAWMTYRLWQQINGPQSVAFVIN